MGKVAGKSDVETVAPGSTRPSAEDEAAALGPLSSLVIPAAVSHRGRIALPLGFFLLGVVLGHLTGFSTLSGISQILLTSSFTFVGGVLLSYAGLRRRGSDLPDPLRVGAALASFAFGLLLGTPAGVYMRCNKAMNERFLGEPVEHSQCLSGGIGTIAAGTAAPPVAASLIGPMAADRTKCVASQVALSKAITDGEDARRLDQLVHELREACNLPDR